MRPRLGAPLDPISIKKYWALPCGNFTKPIARILRRVSSNFHTVAPIFGRAGGCTRGLLSKGRGSDFSQMPDFGRLSEMRPRLGAPLDPICIENYWALPCGNFTKPIASILRRVSSNFHTVAPIFGRAGGCTGGLLSTCRSGRGSDLSDQTVFFVPIHPPRS